MVSYNSMMISQRRMNLELKILKILPSFMI